MSSPIATQYKTTWQKLQIRWHRRLSHTTRTEILAQELSQFIAAAIPQEKASMTCLDVGCGDMKISTSIERLLPQTLWKCVDIYVLPDSLKTEPIWEKYTSFDGIHLPFPNQSFEIILLTDVLHHVPQPHLLPLLRECMRVANRILIKDHYQYSRYSRFMLTQMDKFGNGAYGVNVPAIYFSEAEFKGLYEGLGWKKIREKKGIQLYGHLPVIRQILHPDWQFIALFSTQSE